MDPTQILPGPGTGAPQVALAPLQSSCEPAQLSRCPRGRCHQNQLGWGFPLLCFPTPNHRLPKPHRVVTSINDHSQRSLVLFAWKFLHHRIGNGQISKEFSQRTMSLRVLQIMTPSRLNQHQQGGAYSLPLSQNQSGDRGSHQGCHPTALICDIHCVAAITMES